MTVPWWLLLVALAAGGAAGYVWGKRRRQLQTGHDWNNHLLSLLFNTSSLRRRMRYLLSSDTHFALDEIALDIEAQGRVMMGQPDRLAKVLAMNIGRLECDEKCPGCREVGPVATNLVVNLAINAKEAAARAGGTDGVQATCDHHVFRIVNPLPPDAPTDVRRHLGLGQANHDASTLGWKLRSGPDGAQWVAEVVMAPPSSSSD